MTALRLGSVLLGSANAADLRAWYIRTFAPDHEGGGPINLGGTLLQFDQRDDVDDTNKEPGRAILNLHVDDFDAAEAQLRAAGVELLFPAADRPVGRFGTFADPDGNYLQIVQFKNHA